MDKDTISEEIMDKDTISREDYLKLQGVIALARQYDDKLDDCIRAAADIVGEDDPCYTYDAVWQPFSVDTLLRKLGIEVEGHE